MKKRIISTIMAVMLTFVSIPLTTSAATNNAAALTVKKVTAKPEETVSVPISIANNTGICGATISISYDKNLTLTDISEGSAFSTLTMTKPGKYNANPVKIVWDGVEEDYTNGTIAVLTFKAPKQSGTYKVLVSYTNGDVLDGDLKPVELTINNGAVVVESESNPGMDNPFVDIKETDYYYNPVLWAVEQGITTGKDATHFLPDGVCTRAQVVTFLWRAHGKPEPTIKNPFVDVDSSKHYYKAVLWALENGITQGKDATHFQPDVTVNRSQVVTFMWRAEGKPEPAIKNPFVDVPKGSYYEKAVLWAYENEITLGKDATHFQPEKECIRAQVVTFLYRNEH